MADENPESPQRWTAKRRAALVVSILKGETSVPAAARKHALTVAEGRGVARAVSARGGERIATRPRDEEALKDEQIKRLNQKIGDLALDLDILKEATKDRLFPRGRPTSEEDDPRGVGAPGAPRRGERSGGGSGGTTRGGHTKRSAIGARRSFAPTRRAPSRPQDRRSTMVPLRRAARPRRVLRFNNSPRWLDFRKHYRTSVFVSSAPGSIRRVRSRGGR